MKYRKKPVVIDAVQWTGTNKREMFDFLANGNCPVCNREGLHKSDFYCNKCGQKLDWGEKNGR